MSTAATRVLIRAAEACASRPEPHEVGALIEALVDRVLEHRAETYPPQVRASASPAIGNPACVSPDAEGERQPPAAITHADGSPLRAPTMPPEVPVAEVSLTRRGSSRSPTSAEIDAIARDVFAHGCAVDRLTKRRTIEHTSPTGALTTESDAERFARAEAMFSGSPKR
jgi:hypothetical protein